MDARHAGGRSGGNARRLDGEPARLGPDPNIDPNSPCVHLGTSGTVEMTAALVVLDCHTTRLSVIDARCAGLQLLNTQHPDHAKA